MARPVFNIKHCSLFKIQFILSKKKENSAITLGRSLFQWFFYTATLIFCHSSFANGRCENTAATLESVEGVVEWSVADDHWQQATRGDAFCYGDKIRILEQRAALRLANDTVVRLRENSVVTLMPEDKGFWVELVQGAGHFLSRTPKQLTIKAAYLNAAIDGTEFVVAVEEQRNRVAVFEGDVRVFNRYGEVRLGEGTETSATATTAPDPARSIRLRDAAEWILYYPPLIIQNQTDATISALMDQERYADALNQLDQQTISAEDATLAASLAMVSGQPSSADRLLNRALQQNPQSPEARALQALKALTTGNDQAALSQTSALLQIDPDNISVLLAHAYALQSQGKIEEALKTNRQALSLVPDNLFILARTAELELSSGNTRAARKLIDRALQKAPNHSRVNTLAGFIALNRFANKEAQTYFHTAINSNDSEPLARLGLALALIQKGKIQQGRAEMEMAVLLDPGSSLLRSYLGKTYAAQDQNDWADTQYQLAKNLDPNDPTPWFYEAHLKHEENKPGEALRLITTAIEKNDNRAVYRSRMLLDSDAAARSANLSSIYEKLDFTETAQNTAALAASKNPTDFAAHQALITAYSSAPQAQVLRSRQALITRLLAPIGAKELSVGVGETGLQTFPWVSPGRTGANEHSSLFAQRGLHGNFTSFLGSQNSQGYDWQIQAIGDRTSISGGQYDYVTDGHKTNNDLDIGLDEGNIHYQATDNIKAYLQYSHTDHKSGDLKNSPKSLLFNGNARNTKLSEQLTFGIHGQAAEKTDILLTHTESKRENRLTTINGTSLPSAFLHSSVEATGDFHQQQVALYSSIKNYSLQLGLQREDHDAEGIIQNELKNSGFTIQRTTNSTFENSQFRSFYMNLGINHKYLDTILGVGATKIRHHGTVTFSDNEPTYQFGLYYKPRENLSVSAANWKTMAGRLPSTPSFQTSELFNIITLENIANFSQQTSSEIKLFWTDNDIFITTYVRSSKFYENILKVDRSPPTRSLSRIDETQAGININYLINPTFSLTTHTAFSREKKLSNEVVTNRLNDLEKFNNSIRIAAYPNSATDIFIALNYTQQQSHNDTSQETIQTQNGNGITVDFSTRIRPTNTNILVALHILNIFNENIYYEHSSLREVSESIAPTQPLWPSSRTLALVASMKI